jgi:hypothetical protein
MIVFIGCTASSPKLQPISSSAEKLRAIELAAKRGDNLDDIPQEVIKIEAAFEHFENAKVSLRAGDTTASLKSIHEARRLNPWHDGMKDLYVLALQKYGEVTLGIGETSCSVANERILVLEEISREKAQFLRGELSSCFGLGKPFPKLDLEKIKYKSEVRRVEKQVAGQLQNELRLIENAANNLPIQELLIEDIKALAEIKIRSGSPQIVPASVSSDSATVLLSAPLTVEMVDLEEVLCSSYTRILKDMPKQTFLKCGQHKIGVSKSFQRSLVNSLKESPHLGALRVGFEYPGERTLAIQNVSDIVSAAIPYKLKKVPIDDLLVPISTQGIYLKIALDFGSESEFFSDLAIQPGSNHLFSGGTLRFAAPGLWIDGDTLLVQIGKERLKKLSSIRVTVDIERTLFTHLRRFESDISNEPVESPPYYTGLFHGQPRVIQSLSKGELREYLVSDDLRAKFDLWVPKIGTSRHIYSPLIDFRFNEVKVPNAILPGRAIIGAKKVVSKSEVSGSGYKKLYLGPSGLTINRAGAKAEKRLDVELLAIVPNSIDVSVNDRFECVGRFTSPTVDFGSFRYSYRVKLSPDRGFGYEYREIKLEEKGQKRLIETVVCEAGILDQRSSLKEPTIYSLFKL